MDFLQLLPWFISCILTVSSSCPSDFSLIQPPTSYPPAWEYRSDPWVLAALVLSAAGALVTLVLQAYILHAARRHRLPASSLWLGQTLLFSLFLSHLLACAYSVLPSPVSCGLLTFSLPLLYSCHFSILLIKLLLILLASRGRHPPISSQVLLLLLLNLVQLSLSSQSLILRPPDVCWRAAPPDTSGYLYQCNTSIRELILSLLYPMLLILAGAAISIKEYRLLLGHREGLFLALCFAFTIPIWVIWTLVASLTKDTYKYADGSVALGLLATSTLLLLVMFMPKVRRLHRLHKKVDEGSVRGGGGSLAGSLAGGLSMSAVSESQGASLVPPSPLHPPPAQNHFYNGGGSFARQEDLVAAGEDVYSLGGGKVRPGRAHSVTHVARAPSTRSYVRSRSTDALDATPTVVENKHRVLGDNYYYVNRGSPEIIRHGSLRSIRSAPAHHHHSTVTLTNQLSGRVPPPRGHVHTNSRATPRPKPRQLKHQTSIASSHYSQRSGKSQRSARNRQFVK